MMRACVAWVVVCAALTMPARAQDMGIHYVAGLSWQLLSHDAQLQGIGVTTPCVTFGPTTSQGGQIVAGIAWESDGTRIACRVAPAISGVTLTSRVDGDLPVLDESGKPVAFVRDYSLATTLTRIPVTFEYSIRILPVWFTIGAGPELRFLSRASESATVVSPANVTFDDSTRSHSIGSASLPGMQPFGLTIVLGLSFDLPMGGSMRLSPGVRASMSVPSFLSTETWIAGEINAGVTVSGLLSRVAAPVPSAPAPHEPEPVVITTIIKTGPGEHDAADTTSAGERLFAYDAGRAGTVTDPAAIASAIVDGVETRFGPHGVSQMDIAQRIGLPMSVSVALLGSARSRAARWSFAASIAGDTMLHRAGTGPAPAVFAVPDSVLDRAIWDSANTVRFEAEIDLVGGGRVIPASIDVPTREGNAPAGAFSIRRWVLDAALDPTHRVAIVDSVLHTCSAHARVRVTTSGTNRGEIDAAVQDARQRGVIVIVRTRTDDKAALTIEAIDRP